jgi:hypothetical protein
MARYELTGPDGARYEITAPDDASEAQVLEFFKSQAPGLSTPKPKPFNFDRPDAEIRSEIAALPANRRKQVNAEWGAKRDAALQKQGLGPGALGLNIARGTPVGSWLDEIGGGIDAGLYAVSGGRTGLPYEESNALSEARNKRVDEQSTKLGTLPVIGDVTVGGLQKLAGGVMSAPFAPAVRVFGGQSTLAQMVNAGLTGLGYGALYGAGEGDTVSERAGNAAVGGTIGLGLGAAAPPIVRGLGNAYDYVSNQMRGLPQELAGYARGAVDRVHRAFTADDAAAVIDGTERARQLANIPQGGGPYRSQSYDLARARVEQKTPDLGPDGMLVDYGNNLLRQGDTLANRPGESAVIAKRAINDRSNMRPARIAEDINDTLGVIRADDETARRIVSNANRQATPYYEQLRHTPVRVSEDLQRYLGAAREVGAYEKARRLIVADGLDPNMPETNAAFIDYVKRAVDDLARGAGLGTNENRIFSNLARNINAETDRVLVNQGALARDQAGNIMRDAQGQPLSVWAAGRQISGQGKDVRDAIEIGNQMFRRGDSADQLRAQIQGMTAPEVAGVQQGGRNYLRTQQVTTNRDGQVVNPLSTYDSQQKIGMVVRGQTPQARAANAQQLTNRFNAEAKMMETERGITGNSLTEPRRQAAQEFPMPLQSGDPALSQIRSSTLTGAAAEAIYRAANALTAGMLNERRTRIARDAARMLFAQGATRDEIIQGLIQHGQTMGLTQQQRQIFERNVQRFIDGLRPQAVQMGVEAYGQPSGRTR